MAGIITIAGMVGSVVLGAASDRIRRRRPFLVLPAWRRRRRYGCSGTSGQWVG